MAREIPPIHLRRAMLLVAVVPLPVGLPIEIRRLRKLSEGYKIRSDRADSRERSAMKDVARSHEEWAAIVEKLDREEKARGVWYRTGRPHSPEKTPRVIRCQETLRPKYERLARYPWLPVGSISPIPK